MHRRGLPWSERLGKETMHRRKNRTKSDNKQCAKIKKTCIRLGIELLLLGGLLCGCTRKEELLFVEQTTSHDARLSQEGEKESSTAQEDGNSVEGEPQSSGFQGTGNLEEGERQSPTFQGTGNLIEDGQENLSEEKRQGQADGNAFKEAGYIEAGNAAGKIYVHVCGAVKQPGVYALEPESRVYEAVMAAGGFTEEADEDYVNQAQSISDGVKLQIPTREEVATGSVESTAAGITGGSVESTAAGITGGGNVPATAEPEILQDGRIDINTATEAQLCGIPGIGATRAAAIAAYRQEHGRFDRIEDIMKVNGIKEGTFEKIKDAIKVD